MNNVLACFKCGHVWTDLDPGRIRALIESQGGELARQHLAVLEFGPYHDVPDFPEAHEAARRVAEIDALVLAGRDVEAKRRFRELTHIRWGETIDAINGWHTLRRPQKLALFGWKSKDEPEEVDPRLARHPMHDPLLDG